MEPWVTIVLTGAAIAGYGWLIPQANAKKQGETALPSEEAYDRLLEDLETENRELVDAVAKFKDEQDETVSRLGRRIRELERQMGDWADRERTAATARSVEPAEGRPSDAPPQASVAAVTPVPAPQPLAEPAFPLVGNEPPQPPPAPPEPTPETPLSIRSRYAELMALHHNGRSIEQIARSLGMNKGEVQLILQLARREEDRHA